MAFKLKEKTIVLEQVRRLVHKVFSYREEYFVLILYCAPWCPKCLWVEDNLRSLRIEYRFIKVAREAKNRHDLFRDTGQRTIPALVDGDKVFLDEWEIVQYAKQIAGRKHS